MSMKRPGTGRTRRNNRRSHPSRRPFSRVVRRRSCDNRSGRALSEWSRDDGEREGRLSTASEESLSRRKQRQEKPHGQADEGHGGCVVAMRRGRRRRRRRRRNKKEEDSSDDEARKRQRDNEAKKRQSENNHKQDESTAKNDHRGRRQFSSV
ncbi:hypothetical protein ACHAXS_000992, partial [Conticribra weissflogii]